MIVEINRERQPDKTSVSSIRAVFGKPTFQ